VTTGACSWAEQLSMVRVGARPGSTRARHGPQLAARGRVPGWEIVCGAIEKYRVLAVFMIGLGRRFRPDISADAQTAPRLGML